MYLQHAHLFSPGSEIVHNLFNGLGDRAHGDDYILCLRITIVIEGFVVAAGQLGYLLHVIGYNVRNGFIVGITSLSGLEEDIRVLGSSSSYRTLRIESAASEILNCLPVQHLGKIIIIQNLDLLNFV